MKSYGYFDKPFDATLKAALATHPIALRIHPWVLDPDSCPHHLRGSYRDRHNLLMNVIENTSLVADAVVVQFESGGD